MSQENVELVRLGIEHLSRTGEPLWEALDPDVELVIDASVVLGELSGTYRGHQGVRSFFERWRGGLGVVLIEIDDLIDAGDRVVVSGRFGFYGESSSISAERPVGWVARVRDGRIFF